MLGPRTPRPDSGTPAQGLPGGGGANAARGRQTGGRVFSVRFCLTSWVCAMLVQRRTSEARTNNRALPPPVITSSRSASGMTLMISALTNPAFVGRVCCWSSQQSVTPLGAIGSTRSPTLNGQCFSESCPVEGRLPAVGSSRRPFWSPLSKPSSGEGAVPERGGCSPAASVTAGVSGATGRPQELQNTAWSGSSVPQQEQNVALASLKMARTQYKTCRGQRVGSYRTMAKPWNGSVPGSRQRHPDPPPGCPAVPAPAPAAVPAPCAPPASPALPTRLLAVAHPAGGAPPPASSREGSYAPRSRHVQEMTYTGTSERIRRSRPSGAWSMTPSGVPPGGRGSGARHPSDAPPGAATTP